MNVAHRLQMAAALALLLLEAAQAQPLMFEEQRALLLNVKSYGATGSQVTVTCNSRAGSNRLTGCSDLADFRSGPYAGVLIPHAGANCRLPAPPPPAVTDVALANDEPAIIGTDHAVRVQHADHFVRAVAVRFDNDGTDGYETLINVGDASPASGEYRVSQAGTFSFSPSDINKHLAVSYYWNDQAGTTRHSYRVAACDEEGGCSASSRPTTTTSQPAASRSQFSELRITPVAVASFYAVYRDDKLLGKIDPLPSWEPDYPVEVNEIIDPGNGHEYVAIQPGVTGRALPRFSTLPSSIVLDRSESMQGDTSVIWKENGRPAILWDDSGAPALCCSGKGLEPESAEPNVPLSPTSVPVSDALLTTIRAIQGGQVVLADPASGSIRDAPVYHDDSSALQAAFAAAGNAKRAIYAPPGIYNLARTVEAPDTPHGLIITGLRQSFYTNQLYGSAYYQGTANTAFADGTTLRAILPIRTVVGFSRESQVPTPGPVLSGLSVVGYGAGNETCIELSRAHGTGPISFAEFRDVQVYNCRRGLDALVQWSRFEGMVAQGDWDGIVERDSIGGNNDNLFIEPLLQYNAHIGFLVRQANHNSIIGGNSESGRVIFDLVNASNTTITNFEQEIQWLGPQTIPWPAANLIHSATETIIDGGKWSGWRPGSVGDTPGWLVYQSLGLTLNRLDPPGDLRFGLSTLAIGPVGALVIRGENTAGAGIFLSARAVQSILLLNQTADRIVDLGRNLHLDVSQTGDLRFNNGLVFGSVYSRQVNPLPVCNELANHARICVSDAQQCINGLAYAGESGVACLLWCNGSR